VLAGCGGDDGGGGGDGESSQALRVAVARTEAAKTARMRFDSSITGPRGTTFRGEALVDFEHDRVRLSMGSGGETIQMFSDGSDEYVRRGTSGRYSPLPQSAQSPVANNPTDSLKYLGTDVVDVRRGDESGCYEGDLDFDRVIQRVEAGREGEVPDQLRGLKAPVVVCVDSLGRIRRYDVELSVEGAEVKMTSTLTDYGRVPPVEPLSAGERPR
jgi:hypothetical protein